MTHAVENFREFSIYSKHSLIPRENLQTILDSSQGFLELVKGINAIIVELYDSELIPVFSS